MVKFQLILRARSLVAITSRLQELRYKNSKSREGHQFESGRAHSFSKSF